MADVEKLQQGFKYECPAWADVTKKGFGCSVEDIIADSENITGYRNKCELSIGRGFAAAARAHSATAEAAKQAGASTSSSSSTPAAANQTEREGNEDVECGFVVRMDAASGEQLIAPADGVPNIPVEFKVIARALQDLVAESGLPYYRRTHLEKGAEGDGLVGGFWRLCMCRMVDTDPKRPILMLLQTTSLPDEAATRAFVQYMVDRLVKRLSASEGGVEFEGAKVKVNIQSIYLQFNDDVSDVIDTSIPQQNFERQWNISDDKTQTSTESESSSSSFKDFVKAQNLRSFVLDNGSKAKRAVRDITAKKGEIKAAKKATEGRYGNTQVQGNGPKNADDEELQALFSVAHSQSRILHIFGARELEMPLFGLKFDVGPLSFFQTNSKVCHLLYKKGIDWAMGVEEEEQVGKETAEQQQLGSDHLILDVCCGVGTIGCIAHELTGRKTPVIGLELIKEAVISAETNKKTNFGDKCNDVHFLCGKAEQLLPQLFSEQGFVGVEQASSSSSSTSAAVNSAPADNEIIANNDVNKLRRCVELAKKAKHVIAIVDPPRTGLHKNVLKALRDNHTIDKVVYISCNAESMADDVTHLCHPQGVATERFVPLRVRACDMFPHTVHCEMIAELERFDPENKTHVEGKGQAEWLTRKLEMRAAGATATAANGANGEGEGEGENKMEVESPTPTEDSSPVASEKNE